MVPPEILTRKFAQLSALHPGGGLCGRLYKLMWLASGGGARPFDYHVAFWASLPHEAGGNPGNVGVYLTLPRLSVIELAAAGVNMRTQFVAACLGPDAADADRLDTRNVRLRVVAACRRPRLLLFIK